MLDFWGAVIAVVIGVILSTLGQLLNNAITYWREKEQWKREQKAAREREEREQRKQEVERVRSNYRIAMRAASTLSEWSDSDESQLSKAKKSSLLEELAEAVTEYVLHFRKVNPDYDKMNGVEHAFDLATSGPDRHFDWIVKTLSDAAKADPVLYPNIVSGSESDGRSNKREITVSISDEFRKQQFIEGKEVPGSYTFEYDVVQLPRSQRSFLAERFMRNGRVRDSFTLGVPKDERNVQTWEAHLNPEEATPEEIFDEWEKAFKRAKERIEADQEE